ncbi:MAG: hypothetical protein LH471_00035 [Salinibacterium sp.]|nr:hypothetical protein [Salinibacterium sp.]
MPKTQDDINYVNVSGSLTFDSVGDIPPAFSSHCNSNTENTFAFTFTFTRRTAEGWSAGLITF